MAITKIHSIISTLNLAIDYITKSEKTDEKILVSSFKCHPSTAHIQFLKTREDNDTKGTVLAIHLIQFVYLNKPMKTNIFNEFSSYKI